MRFPVSPAHGFLRCAETWRRLRDWAAAIGVFIALLVGGGRARGGVVFEVVHSCAALDAPSVQHPSSNADGNYPSNLVVGPNGVLYGIAGCGPNGTGVLFSVTISGAKASYKVIHSFGPVQPDGNNDNVLNADGGENGAGGHYHLTVGEDGNLYGVTQRYGQHALGTIFRSTLAGHVTVLSDLTDPDYPGSYLTPFTVTGPGEFLATQLSSTTTSGGHLITVSTSGVLTPAFEFDPATAALGQPHINATGAVPDGTLVKGKDGRFYGVTEDGGALGLGVLYVTDASGGSISVLHHFDGGASNKQSGNDGARPWDSPILGYDGNLYGCTQNGGDANGDGTIYCYTSSGTYKTLYTFTGGADGQYPKAALVQASDGSFYGTTVGGVSEPGTAFRMVTDGNTATVDPVYQFDVTMPEGLVEGLDGNMYGTLAAGNPPNFGANGTGGIFRLVTKLPSGGPPEAVTGRAAAISYESATLNGAVNPHGLPAVYWFDYGSTDQYGTSSPMLTVGHGNAAVAERLALGGLAPHTAYHFRINCKSDAGTTSGADATFTTANHAPLAGADSVPLAASQSAPVQIDVLSNDADLDGDPLTVTAVSVPRFGVASIVGAGPGNQVSYTPGPGYAAAGSDTFTYTVSDGFGGLTRASVSLRAKPFAARAGVFAALISDASAVPLGYANIVLGATGTLTATITVNGVRQIVRGVFNSMGQFTSADGSVQLQCDLSDAGGDPGSFSLTGTVANAGGSPFTFTAQHASVAGSGQPAEAGVYTALVRADATVAGSPQGTGFGALHVGAGGLARIAGALADGSPWSAGGPLVGPAASHRQLILFPTLYGGRGLLIGQLAFAPSSTGAVQGSLRWSKPALGGMVYPNGFDARPSLVADLYTIPPVTGVPLNISQPVLSFTGGGLPDLQATVTLTAPSRIQITGQNPQHIMATLNRLSGALGGSFTASGAPSIVHFSGLIRQNATAPTAEGYFLGPVESGARTSGLVQLAPAQP